VAKQEGRARWRRNSGLLAGAKKMTLFAAGAATQRFAAKLADEQEVMGALANMMIESLLWRARCCVRRDRGQFQREGAAGTGTLAATLGGSMRRGRWRPSSWPHAR